MLIKSELKKIPNCACPEFTAKEIEKCKYILAVKIHNDILVADYFTTEGFNLQVRFFCDKKNYITYYPYQDKWDRRALSSQFGDETCIPCHEKSEYIATKFLGIEKVNWGHPYYIGYHRYEGAHGAICYFISKRFAEKNTAARDRKEALKKYYFSLFTEPMKYPDNVKKFLNDVAFKPYIFFSNLDKKHNRKCVCSHCGRSFTISADVKHKDTMMCPKCNCSAELCATRYASSRKDKIVFCYPERNKDKLLFSFYNIHREFNDMLKPVYDLDNFAISIYQRDKNGWKIQSYGYTNQSYYWGSFWGDWGHNPIYRAAYIYPGNLAEMFGTSYHNVNLTALFENQPYPIDFAYLLNNLERYPITEYLVKNKLYRIADSDNMTSILNTDGRNFGTVFGINPNYKKLYQEKGVTVIEHRVIQCCKDYVDFELFDRYRKLKISYSLISSLLRYMSMRKAVSYIEKQRHIMLRMNNKLYDKSAEHIGIQLRDYINMCEYLDIKLSKDNMFPQNIKDSHDRLLKRYRIVQAEKMRQESIEALRLVNDFFTGYEVGNLMIKVPKSRKDFIKEGEELHHCVGMDRYYQNHIKGDSMIFFIRKKDNPKKPYVTAEIDMHKFYICQIYGNHDSPATKEVRAFAQGFVEWLKREKSVIQKAG